LTVNFPFSSRDDTIRSTAAASTSFSLPSYVFTFSFEFRSPSPNLVLAMSWRMKVVSLLLSRNANVLHTRSPAIRRTGAILKSAFLIDFDSGSTTEHADVVADDVTLLAVFFASASLESTSFFVILKVDPWRSVMCCHGLAHPSTVQKTDFLQVRAVWWSPTAHLRQRSSQTAWSGLLTCRTGTH